MASLAGSGVVALYGGVPGIGWAAVAGIQIGAALIDSYVIMPALAGKGRSAAKPPQLLDAPVGSNEPGAPRIWAIGRRVRVPTHVLWQSEKVRESTSTNSKAGTSVVQRRVYVDALVALNDRQTQSLTQLIGNGKLVLFATRNIVTVTTAGMTLAVAGSQLVLTMVDNDEPDFADHFAVGDIVRTQGWVVTAGAVNGLFWKVAAVTAHTASGGSITLDAFGGQTVAGIAATAGTAVSPARVERVDDVAFETGTATTLNGGSIWLFAATGGHLPPDDVFTPGDLCRIENFTASIAAETANLPTHVWRVLGVGATSITMQMTTGYLGSATLTGTATSAGRILFASPQTFSAGLFPSSFVPANHYHDGSETQGEDSLLAADKGTGNVPAYRGVACQALDEFYVNQFGDSLPFSLEALIDPDVGMTWPAAFAEVLKRSGIPDDAIDTSGMTARPFDGAFLRGAVPAITAMQPMILASQALGQERDGTICIFEIENADAVEVLHEGDVESDLGCIMDGDARVDNDLVIEDVAPEDLPTSVGVRHQDPDNGYAAGFQHFGLRQPGGPIYENRAELDLSTVVLTRKQARALATTVLRRAHINRRTYRMVLNARYLDLLENDVVTFTYKGVPIVARILQRDIGSDWRVSIVAVAEDLDVVIRTANVQTAAGSLPPTVSTSTDLTVVPLDIPALADSETQTPGLKLAVCAATGGVWAGAAIYVSMDGSTWEQRGVVGAQAGIGTLVTTMEVETPAESYGTTTVTTSVGDVDVEFEDYGPFGLEDATLAEAIAGKNWCAIIDADGTVEIAAFMTATFNGGTTWTLDNWLRGLRGTKNVAHADGARFVLLSPFYGSGVVHLEFPGLIQPQSMTVRVVPAGRSLEDVESVGVAATWRNARPLPVRSAAKTIGASPFDARFTVQAHWCKTLLPLGTQPPHPMDEPYEGYLLTIYDPTGTVAKRTKTIQAQPSTGSSALRDKRFTYTAAEQTADGYTPSAVETFWIDVQQIGAFGLSPSIKQEL